MDKIKKDLELPLKEINLYIDSINFDKGALNIILESLDDEIVDINKIVSATHIINNILDSKDYIKDKYILDVSSKERGSLEWMGKSF
jgi:Uncharacterised BCR, YhbC family COG0779.